MIRLMTKVTGPVYSFIWSMGSTPSQIKEAFVVANWGKTRPGQSQSVILDERLIVWKCFVFPGVEETLTFFSPMRALIVLDFPTLG